MVTTHAVENPNTTTLKQGGERFSRIAVKHASTVFALRMNYLRMGGIFTADLLVRAMAVGHQMRRLGDMIIHQGFHGRHFFILDGKGPHRTLALNGDHDSLFGRTFASLVASTRLRAATDVGFINFHDAT